MKNLILGLLIVFAVNAFAQKATETPAAKTTEIFAPAAGASEVILGLLIPTGSIEYQGRSSNYSGFLFGAQYGYGITENFAVYGAQSYSNYDIKSNFSGTSITSKIKGLGNTQIGVKGIIDSAPGYFYYNVNYSRAIFEKDKTNSSSNESTAASARPSLNFVVAGGADVDSFGFGGGLGYSIYQEGDQESESNSGSSTTTYKSGNGSNWKVYTQYGPSWKFGVSYGVVTVDSYDQTRTNSITQVEKSETKNLSLYGIIPVNAYSEFFIDAVKFEPKETHGADYKVWYLSTTYRMGF